MTILYDHSAMLGALVVGTSNKTELLLGYGTLFGDMASAVNPIGDLFKTQVRQLSRHVGVPAQVVDKAPSADLWVGQTDEQELGYTYEVADAVLYRMIDCRYTREELLDRWFYARTRGRNTKTGAAQPVQETPAAHRQDQPAHDRSRFPLRQGLGAVAPPALEVVPKLWQYK